MTVSLRPVSRPQWRSIHGIVLLDKATGVTSNHALQQVRRLFRADKGGHTGSLDPLATGLLPICFGEATKIAGILLGESKAYEALVRLGATTDTDDADGVILRERPIPVIDERTLDAALAPLRGRIRQRPPIYAALKQGGEPMYAKARRGEIVEATSREVVVHRLECSARAQGWLRLRVECGSGTYVRSIVRDLGEALGCGAHVAELRRLWVEPFRAPVMHTFDALRAAGEADPAALDVCVLPIEAGLAGLPRLVLDSERARRVGQGQAVRCDAGVAPSGTIALFDESGRALGLGRNEADGVVRAQRLFVWAVA